MSKYIGSVRFGNQEHLVKTTSLGVYVPSISVSKFQTWKHLLISVSIQIRNLLISSNPDQRI